MITASTRMAGPVLASTLASENPRWQADQQAEAGQRQAGGDWREPPGPVPGDPVDAQHDDGGGADGDQGGQGHGGQRHRAEITALVERGQSADHRDTGPGRAAGRPAPAGQGEESHDQHTAAEPVGGHRQGGKSGDPAQQDAGQATSAPQNPRHHQAGQAPARLAAGRGGQH
jgi:hypothetical protein